MASGIAPPAGQGMHYGDTSVITDVTDIIYQITPEDTPFFHLCSDGPAVGAPWHEWQRRELVVRSDNANFEGFNYTFTSASRLPVRDGNVLQILAKDIRISNTNQAIQHYAIPNMRADQVEVQLAELKTDIEHGLLRGTLATGNLSVARRMNGLIPQCMSSVSMFSNSAPATFTESRFNGLQQMGWDAGAALRDVLVGGGMKRTISTFTGLNARVIASELETQYNSIDVIHTDFGPVNMHLSRDVGSHVPYVGATNTTLARSVLAIDKSHLKKAWLRPVGVQKTAVIADSEDYIAACELTLEWGHRLAHALWHGSSAF